MSSQSSGASSYRSQGLHATVHLACPHCGAPGVYSHQLHIQAGWAGCWVAEDHRLCGQPVGPICPNCNNSRSPSLIEQLGEIWRKYF